MRASEARKNRRRMTGRDRRNGPAFAHVYEFFHAERINVRPGLFIAGIGLAAVAAASVVLLRRRDESQRREHAAQFGWKPANDLENELQDRLRGLTLMQVGHSRCIEYVFRADDGLYLLPYLCETGVERRRQLHRWVVAVAEMPLQRSFALISSQAWLMAAAHLPGRTRKSLSPTSGSSEGLAVLVEDEQDWKALQSPAVREWLHGQPTTRSWECHGNLLVGYDPGPISDAGFRDLPNDLRQFRQLLRAHAEARALTSAGSV